MEQRLGAEAWIEAGLLALVQGGVEALRVETIAKSLGVTKGSFYWHFKDRRDLLDRVLAFWEQRATERVMERVEKQGGDARQKLQRLIELCTTGEGDQIEGAIRAWAGADAAAQEIVQRIDKKREKYVVELMRELGMNKEVAVARSRILYLALIGEFTWTSTGGKSSPRGIWSELYTLLLQA